MEAHMLPLLTVLDPFTLSARHLYAPFPNHHANIYALLTTGHHPVDLWVHLRNAVPTTGYWPIIIGTSERIAAFQPDLPATSNARLALLREAAALDPIPELLALENRQRRDLRVSFRDYRLPLERPDLTDYPSDAELATYTDVYYQVLEAELAEAPGTRMPHKVWDRDHLRAPARLALAAEEPSHILLIPTMYSWETLAFLGWQTAGLATASAVAFLKRWSTDYGVELIAVQAGGVGIDVYLSQPLASPEVARRLAWEMALVAPEPDQVSEVEHSAAHLYHGQRFWSLWWD
jgi:hypothetical protein